MVLYAGTDSIPKGEFSCIYPEGCQKDFEQLDYFLK